MDNQRKFNTARVGDLPRGALFRPKLPPYWDEGLAGGVTRVLEPWADLRDWISKGPALGTVIVERDAKMYRYSVDDVVYHPLDMAHNLTLAGEE